MRAMRSRVRRFVRRAHRPAQRASEARRGGVAVHGETGVTSPQTEASLASPPMSPKVSGKEFLVTSGAITVLVLVLAVVTAAVS